MSPKGLCKALVASLATTLALASFAGGDEPKEAAAIPAVPAPSEEAADPVPELSGEEIYDRVLSNRFKSFDQSLEMISGDRAGNAEVVKMELKYKSFREERKKYFSMSIAKYESPADVRHMGYLIINKKAGADDQFVYLPSARRVRRINLRGESVAGTDFSLEDIIPRELEDASYSRLPDEVLEGLDVYVVEVRPQEESKSEYSKFVAYVGKTSFVTLRTLYWDSKGVEFKKLTAVVDSITQYGGDEASEDEAVWVARESKIENTQLESYTTLKITRLVANPKLGSKDFTQRKLAQSH